MGGAATEPGQQRSQGSNAAVHLRQVRSVAAAQLWDADADEVHIAVLSDLPVGTGERQPTRVQAVAEESGETRFVDRASARRLGGCSALFLRVTSVHCVQTPAYC
jgi:hypothetical protein